MARGIFISLEGLDGCGKTSQAKFIVEYLKSVAQTVHVREPGGTPVGEKIREIFLNEYISPQAEALLLIASRLTMIDTVIKPALDNGWFVVSERFMDSTYALQGYGRGILKEVEILDEHFIKGFEPYYTLYLHLPVEVSLGRQHLKTKDRFELEIAEFHEKVAQGFNARYEASNKDSGRIIKIDAARSQAEVTAQIKQWLDTVVIPQYLNPDNV